MRVETSSLPGGGRIEERMTGIGGVERRASRAPSPATARARTPAITQDQRRRRRRAAITGAATPAWDPDSAIHRSSLPRSRALCQRSSASLARHFLTTRSRAGGDIGWTLEIGAGSLDMIAVINDAWLVAEKAFFAVAISYKVAPNAKMSVLASASLPSSCSGAMYWNVPRIVPSCVNPCCVGRDVRLDFASDGDIAFA